MPFKRQYNKLLGQCISCSGMVFVTGTFEHNTEELSKSKASTKDSKMNMSYWIKS